MESRLGAANHIRCSNKAASSTFEAPTVSETAGSVRGFFIASVSVTESSLTSGTNKPSASLGQVPAQPHQIEAHPLRASVS